MHTQKGKHCTTNGCRDERFYSTTFGWWWEEGNSHKQKLHNMLAKGNSNLYHVILFEQIIFKRNGLDRLNDLEYSISITLFKSHSVIVVVLITSNHQFKFRVWYASSYTIWSVLWLSPLPRFPTPLPFCFVNNPVCVMPLLPALSIKHSKFWMLGHEARFQVPDFEVVQWQHVLLIFLL